MSLSKSSQSQQLKCGGEISTHGETLRAALRRGRCHFVSLKIPLDWNQAARENTNPMNSYEDFAFIPRQLFLIKSSFEFLVNSTNGLNTITGNKEATLQNERYSRWTREELENSLKEARKASILTFLATVFVPLTVTAGIFSMSSEWGPGGDKCGYY